MLLVVATLGSCLLCLVLLALCRIWRRNRYYKKVQVSLDEEERAFQETLARSYQDDTSMDAADQQKLQMLEAYLQTQTPVNSTSETQLAVLTSALRLGDL